MKRYRAVLKATSIVLLAFIMFFTLDIVSGHMYLRIARAFVLTLVTLGGGYAILRWIQGSG